MSIEQDAPRQFDKDAQEQGPNETRAELAARMIARHAAESRDWQGKTLAWLAMDFPIECVHYEMGLANRLVELWQREADAEPWEFDEWAACRAAWSHDQPLEWPEFGRGASR